MPPAAFLDPEHAPKSLAAGALPQTPLGELSLQPSPDPLAGLRGPTSKGRGGEGSEGKEGTSGPQNVEDRLTPL